MSTFLPLNAESRALLLRMINRANGLQLPDQFMDFNQPRTLTPPEQAEHGYNTVVELIARPGATHEGNRFVYYNRLDLGQTFAKYPKVPVTDPFANSFEALAQVNNLYGLHLQPSEIVGIQAIDYATRITILDSYLWVPGSYIEVAVNIDEALLAEIEDFANRIWAYTNFDLPPILNLPMGDF